MKPALRLFQADQGPDITSLDYFAGRYRAHLQSRVDGNDYSPRRLKGTMAYVDSFLRHRYGDDQAAPVRVGALKPEEAKQIHLTAWLTANYQNWKKGSTRADALGAVLGCFNWLEEMELLTSPFRRPRHLKFPRQHLRAMRVEHYFAIWKAARREGKDSLQFRLIFFAFFQTGVRPIEFRQLEPREIDWQASLARVPAHKHKTGRVTGEERPIGLTPPLLRILRKLVDGMKHGQKYVFLSPRGKPWTKDNLGRAYARYRDLAGVDPAIKMCAARHGFAVRALSDTTTSNKAVADCLGHRSTRMVDAIYGAETRHDGELVRKVAASVGKKRRERGAKATGADQPMPLFLDEGPMPLFEA
jgi:integrase